jgi:hypothetical protein
LGKLPHAAPVYGVEQLILHKRGECTKNGGRPSAGRGGGFVGLKPQHFNLAMSTLTALLCD